MTASDVRERYLAFFQTKGHAIVPSSSLVPENDPTTLFTGSGMQPMVPYLLGETHPLGTRLADSQKCFRSQDIEEVGDNRHTTFFEMLGNWSLGDYFKEEQIPWMWEFLTGELGIEPKRLFVTCFRGNKSLGIPKDEISAGLWQNLFRKMGVQAEIVDFPERNGMQGGRIFYYDEKKNWWSRAGVPGNMPDGEPGGPDTEMFYDFGEDLGLHEQSPWKSEPCHVNCDCGRFMEIGNNVFMEYRKMAGGFEKLPRRNVDFGGGLERIAAAVRGDSDIFCTDLFDSAREKVESLSDKKYGESDDVTRAFRVLLDHLRAAMFLIGDGVLPSNKDQGYFVRRLIRRAVRFGKEIGIVENFVDGVAQAFIRSYGEAYPMLVEREERILRALHDEEVKFRATLDRGMKEFGKRIESGSLSGKDAFDLFATYGFPYEMTRELAEERKMHIDDSAFRDEFEKHRDLSRTASAGKFKGGLADASEKTTALHTATHLMLAGLRKFLGDSVHQAGSNITEERTRFDFTYPEKVPREMLDKVETYVNEAIEKGSTVKTDVMEKESARRAGVEGSFWEKYPEKVTVYQVVAPDGMVYSRELCGGPHVTETRNMGRFRIVKEEASSAGVRRVKAILT